MAERSSAPSIASPSSIKPGIGLADQRLLPGRRLVLERKDLGRAVCEAGRDLGIEPVAGALTYDADRVLLAAQHALKHRVARDVHDSERQRDLVRLGAAEGALAVPAFGEMDEETVDRRRERKPLGQHLRDLADRRQVGIPFPSSPSAAGGRSAARGRVESCPASEAREGAQQHLPLGPEGRRDEVRRHRAAEDLRGHVGIGGAARIHQQACVVGLRGRRRGRLRGGPQAASRPTCRAGPARTETPSPGRWPGRASRPPPRCAPGQAWELPRSARRDGTYGRTARASPSAVVRRRGDCARGGGARRHRR